MKTLITALALASLCIFAADKKTFFSGPTDIPKDLPANELYPKGQLFPFGFYSFGGGSGKELKSSLLQIKSF